MQIKLDTLSVDQILDLRKNAAPLAVIIEKGVDTQKLQAFEELLKAQESIKLVLVVDLKKKGTAELVRNLDVLPFLPDLKRLAILSNSSEKVEEISVLSTIKGLNELTLSGFFEKNISFQPLERFESLSLLEVEFGINKVQSKVVNTLKKLESLSVASIDLKEFNTNENFVSLKVTKSAKNHELIADLFPGLKKLFLADCKDIQDFGFINKLKNLQKLSLNYMKQLTAFPILKDIKDLTEIELLEAKALLDIDAVSIHNNLEILSLTDAENLEIDRFKKLATLQKLKIVYTRFKSPEKNHAFNVLALQHNWLNKHPSVLC